MAGGIWFLGLFLLISGYELEREKERMCLHLAMNLNWANYRPIADVQKKKPDLNAKKIEEKITWDAFEYCVAHINKATIEEIMKLPSVPNSKLYMEFLKWDDSKYNTDADLEVDPELYVLRKKIDHYDRTHQVITTEEEDKKEEDKRKFEEVKADILAGRRNM